MPEAREFQSNQIEWLLANSVGSFAMGTPGRLPTRKYHGLLIARPEDGSTPWHVLAEVAEEVVAGGERYLLTNFQYDNCVYPDGQHYQTAFNDSPPTWKYRCGDVELRRVLSLGDQLNEATIQYDILSAPDDLELWLTPLISGRRVHDLAVESDGASTESGEPGTIVAKIPGLPEGVALWTSPPTAVQLTPDWNRRVHYDEEARRGYPHVEDLYAPARFHLRCSAGDRVRLRVGLCGQPREAMATAPSRPASDTPAGDDIQARLSRAAESYCVERPSSGTASIIAGYPWFGEWGRDAFIALPGLTLTRGDCALAGRVLDHFRDHRKNGLIPNIVGAAADSTDDHSVDATLFFIQALRRLEAAGGKDVARRWWPDLLQLLGVLRSGAAPGVIVEDSGLLAADRRPRSMTWMDALVDGAAVTPRAPYAVEIQALFHQAIHYALEVADELGDRSFRNDWGDVPQRLSHSFSEMFYCGGHLADSSDGREVDAAIRPNQLFALAGDPPLVRGELAESVLDGVRRTLLTPLGLRTLEPSDPSYRGRCEGSQRERDLAYHQGTVWPWLIGPYIDAVVAVEGKALARRESRRIVHTLGAHLDVGCTGHVAEIFDGDPPHAPRGAPAQAWSVAELLRISTL